MEILCVFYYILTNHNTTIITKNMGKNTAPKPKPVPVPAPKPVHNWTLCCLIFVKLILTNT